MAQNCPHNCPLQIVKFQSVHHTQQWVARHHCWMLQRFSWKHTRSHRLLTSSVQGSCIVQADMGDADWKHFIESMAVLVRSSHVPCILPLVRTERIVRTYMTKNGTTLWMGHPFHQTQNQNTLAIWGCSWREEAKTKQVNNLGKLFSTADSTHPVATAVVHRYAVLMTTFVLSKHMTHHWIRYPTAELLQIKQFTLRYKIVCGSSNEKTAHPS